MLTIKFCRGVTTSAICKSSIKKFCISIITHIKKKKRKKKKNQLPLQQKEKQKNKKSRFGNRGGHEFGAGTIWKHSISIEWNIGKRLVKKKINKIDEIFSGKITSRSLFFSSPLPLRPHKDLSHFHHTTS